LISYKINVTEALKEAGFNASTAKQTGIFSQSTMRKFKEGDTGITLDNLNRLCCILEMQPRDIIKFTETDEDRNNILKNIK
jgi:DNA-binding Xre family transcriptional regulator